MTSLSEALDRRDEAKLRFFREYLGISGNRGKIAAFGMADAADYLPPDRRLAIGVAFGDSERGNKKLFGLALRVSKRGGVAHRAAAKIAEDAEKDGAWADVRVIEGLSIPSRSQVAAIDANLTTGQDFPVGGDPLMMGVSVSHPRAPAGSLGGFVRIKNAGEGIIGACHILANSGRGIDLSSVDLAPLIYHPANSDVRRISSHHQVARLQAYVPLDTQSVEVDAAVATLLPHINHVGNVVPPIASARDAGQRILGPPSSNEAIVSFRNVAKVGRSTKYTEGLLSAGFFDEVPLDVPARGITYYSNLMEIESSDPKMPFAEPGDSGAVIFDVRTRTAFALVVGGGVWERVGAPTVLTYGCSLASSLDALDAEWL